MSLQITHVSCLDVKWLVYLFCSRHKGQEDPQAHCSHLCQRTQQAIRKINVKALRLRRVSDELSIRDARGRPPPPPWLHRGLRGGMVRISVPYARRDGDDRAHARRSMTSWTRRLVADGLRRRNHRQARGGNGRPRPAASFYTDGTALRLPAWGARCVEDSIGNLWPARRRHLSLLHSPLLIPAG